MPDAHSNFAYSAVATAPSPATSGTSLVVTAGQGALFPAVPFNATIWPTGAQPLSSNAEIVRVTARSTDTLTITRQQESTSARTVIVGDQIAATITKKTLTDAEGTSQNIEIPFLMNTNTGEFSSTSYTTIYLPTVFDKSKFTNLTSVVFRADLSQNASGTYSVYAQVYDMTASAVVGSTEITASLSQYAHAITETADIKASLASGANLYSYQIKVSSGSALGIISNLALVARIAVRL